MSWNECNKMDEKLKFIARLLEGEKVTILCREFNISRKTGYKLSATSTVYAVLDRNGLVKKRKRRRYKAGNRRMVSPYFFGRLRRQNLVLADFFVVDTNFF